MEALLIIGIIVFLIWLYLENSKKREIERQQEQKAKILKEREAAAHQKKLEEEKQKKLIEQQEAQKRLTEANRLEAIRLQKLEQEKRLIAERLQREKAEQEYQRLKELNQIEYNRSLSYCENDTTYATLLERHFRMNQQNFNFSTIRRISTDFVRTLTDEQKNELKSQISRGELILQTDEQLKYYNFSFGLMHQAKLKAAFETCICNNFYLPNGENIEIIDYGCGQGIGTIAFLDFLAENTNFGCSISKIKIIEPSSVALKRAALNCRYALKSKQQNAPVEAINKKIEQLSEHELSTSNDNIKFHIFSNILDVEDFNISRLYTKIVSTQKSKNYFICVSPSINSSRNERLNEFCNHFSRKHKHTLISERDSNIDKYTRYEKVFLVEFANSN